MPTHPLRLITLFAYQVLLALLRWNVFYSHLTCICIHHAAPVNSKPPAPSETPKNFAVTTQYGVVENQYCVMISWYYVVPTLCCDSATLCCNNRVFALAVFSCSFVFWEASITIRFSSWFQHDTLRAETLEQKRGSPNKSKSIRFRVRHLKVWDYKKEQHSFGFVESRCEP